MHTTTEHPTILRAQAAPLGRSLPVSGAVASSDAMRLDEIETESLILNMNASLRVYGRHHFFDWTQGLLQSLIRHELLICALRGARSMSFQVHSFATSPVEPELFGELFRQDMSLMPHLVRAWEENNFQPVLCETGASGPFGETRLSKELARIGTDVVIAHGTYDTFGKLISLFAFACRREDVGPKQVYFAELMVPFVHLAWARFQAIQASRAMEGPGNGGARGELLTAREQEILRWVHLGKSNIEIGIILNISSLTVKNHVQKILRKLNVRNRAQAVGKALALRILSL